MLAGSILTLSILTKQSQMEGQGMVNGDLHRKYRRSVTCTSSPQEWPFSPPRPHQQLSTENKGGYTVSYLESPCATSAGTYKGSQLGIRATTAVSGVLTQGSRLQCLSYCEAT